MAFVSRFGRELSSKKTGFRSPKPVSPSNEASMPVSEVSRPMTMA